MGRRIGGLSPQGFATAQWTKAVAARYAHTYQQQGAAGYVFRRFSGAKDASLMLVELSQDRLLGSKMLSVMFLLRRVCVAVCVYW